MDYKAPPQYSSPQPQYAAPAQQLQPQQQHYAQPAPAAAYGAPPQQIQPVHPAHPAAAAAPYGSPAQQPQQYYAPQQYPPQQPQYPQQQHPQYPPQQPQPQPQAHPQPQPQPQPQPVVAAAAAPNSTGWSHGLFDCTPFESCCLGTFLPCILLGQTADRMRDPTMATADAMNSDCLVFTGIQCVTGCGWIYIMMKRSEIRERFGIQGDGTSDCCVTYWCPCCALIQQDNEVKVRTGAVAPVTQGYQAPQGMQMPQK